MLSSLLHLLFSVIDTSPTISSEYKLKVNSFSGKMHNIWVLKFQRLHETILPLWMCVLGKLMPFWILKFQQISGFDSKKAFLNGEA